jgi:hypothetical protein
VTVTTKASTVTVMTKEYSDSDKKVIGTRDTSSSSHARCKCALRGCITALGGTKCAHGEGAAALRSRGSTAGGEGAASGLDLLSFPLGRGESAVRGRNRYRHE